MTLSLMLLLLSLAVLFWIYVQGSRDARRRAQQHQASATVLPMEAPTQGPIPEGTDPDLDCLYVKALGARRFTGREIHDALEDADMQSGEMDMFHYYGDSPNGCRPLVSAADMYEPGTLVPAALDQLETRGLVLFLPSGGGTRAQLAQCARVVAAGLSARVFDIDMRPLNRELLANMCEDEG